MCNTLEQQHDPDLKHTNTLFAGWGWAGSGWSGLIISAQTSWYIYQPGRRWSPSPSPIRLRHPRVPPYQPPLANAGIVPSPPISRSGRPQPRVVPSELPHPPQPHSAPPIGPPAATAAKLGALHQTSRIRHSQGRPLLSYLPHPPPSTSPTAPPASAASNSDSQPQSYPQLHSPFRSAHL